MLLVPALAVKESKPGACALARLDSDVLQTRGRGTGFRVRLNATYDAAILS